MNMIITAIHGQFYSVFTGLGLVSLSPDCIAECVAYYCVIIFLFFADRDDSLIFNLTAV